MEISQYTWNIVDSNSWLLREGRHGLLIDAVEHDELYNAVKEADDLTIILTHAHFDHISGLTSIRALRPDAVVISTAKCSEFLGNTHRNLSSVATAFMAFYKGEGCERVAIEPFVCAPSDQVFEKKKRLDWHGHEIELISVYGHSADGLLALIDKETLFSGDTLLRIPTITRLPGGSSKLFWEEDVPKLKEMTGATRVYPGHGEPGDLLEMLSVNHEPVK